jgi:hypothetical protein
MLARLGQFTETRPGAAGEHSYLPDAAMALIAQYQRNPLLASGQPGREDSGGDATSASYTELPASYLPKPRHQRAPRRPVGWRRWVKAHLAWVGWVSVGAALVVGGVILGASLTSNSDTTGLPPLAPLTVCGTQAAANHMLCMNQSQGDPSAAFIVEGHGFPAAQPVVVKLSEIGPPPGNNPLFSTTSTFRPITTHSGTFQAPISQLYSGSLQPGLVTVQVTAPGGSNVQTQFMVLPPGAPPAGAPPAP